MKSSILREYERIRRSPYATASGALQVARVRVWFSRNWTDDSDGSHVSDDGRFRLSLKPDDSGFGWDDLEGDMFDPKHALPMNGGLRALKAQQKEYRAKVERDGVWGYILEERKPACPTCGNPGRWEHIDSCWGFDDADFCLEEGIAAAHYHTHK